MGTSGIKRKIEALLRIARDPSASDAEVELAMSRARRLMDQHSLSEDDLRESLEEQKEALRQAEYAFYEVRIGAKVYAWESALATVIPKIIPGVLPLIGKQKYRDYKNGKAVRASHVRFAGLTDDVDVAGEVYATLRQTIIGRAMKKYGSVFRGSGACYAQGFCVGLELALRADKKAEVKALQMQNAERGLMLVHRRDELSTYKQSEAKLWYMEHTNRRVLKGPQRRGSHGNVEAYKTGKSDGKSHQYSIERTMKIGMS